MVVVRDIQNFPQTWNHTWCAALIPVSSIELLVVLVFESDLSEGVTCE